MILLVLTGTMAMAQTSVWDGKRVIWTRGEGTEESPFLIESAQNLAYLAYVVNKGYNTENLYFRLTTDIDLNGSEDQQWIPIGMSDRWVSEDGCDRRVQGVSGFSVINCFNGHFDGGEHSISNLYIDNMERNFGAYNGLFGWVRSTDAENLAVVENLFVTSGYIKGIICGGIVGRADNALVSRCWNGATIEGYGSGSQDGSGGIVGWSSSFVQVRNCYNMGTITGYSVAGIVGSGKAVIGECYNEGDISGVYAGGIFGSSLMKPVTISNCYNTGSVSAIDGLVMSSLPAGPAAGGIAGFIFRTGDASGGSITNCYNVGSVSSVKDAGCILAYGSNMTLENNYYITTCLAGGAGESLTEEYMQSQEFVDFLNGLGTGQEWVIDENNTNGGFPILVSIDLSVGEMPEVTFSVYPNPAQGQFTVEGKGTMRIANVMGQEILSRAINGKETVNLPKGLYFIQMNGTVRKIVVE